jgi:hypothetical protein
MGLIKTGLKAAVAVKTAHYVHERIERRQQAQWAAQGQQPAGVGIGAAQGPLGQDPGYGAPAPVVAQAAAAVGTPTTPDAGAGQDRTAVLNQLKDLGDLRAAGVLTEDEFTRQKALILGG